LAQSDGSLRCQYVDHSGLAGSIARLERERDFVQFVSDYMKAIDFMALAALVVIAAASFYRRGTIWLLIAAIVVAIWGAIRLFGLF
jgi:hypothetical protein